MTKKSLIITSLLLIGTSAIAQSNSWYAGATYGKTTVDTGITNLTGSASLDEKDTGYKIFAGYKYNKNISLELQYVDFGKSTVSGDNGDTYKQKNGSIVNFVEDNSIYTFDLKSYGISGLYSYPVSDNFIPFAKIGVHSWKSSWKTAINSKYDDTDMFYGLGVDIPITSNISARVEYELYKADYDLTFLSAGFVYSF